ncbi:cysteine desulfurase family protein [Flavobacterium sp. MK4S-17]|uniref:cysteine desulfurase family protein n=1 Tax=Flavobacterium sp. MK4S-17 TaxID=2543737 RepID=UPI00135A4B74|nr:cysteine desulfurase family protein [Flavobacterium sp. MK4S-17]
MDEKIIYLDNASTTRPDDDVINAMSLAMSQNYGNASSSHQFGERIGQDVEKARMMVASLIGADAEEITFTSGATESINTILKGVVSKNKSNREKIITVETEHSAVLDTCRFLEEQGVEVVYLPVNSDGLIDLSLLEKNLDEDTLLVCVMMVNNETGVVQPIKEITQLVHKAGALMMTDATQSVGKLPIDVSYLDVDFMAFSAHKYYGPKGVGGLFTKKGVNVFSPLIHGGNHEKGKRSGTLNVPSIIGMGVASQKAQDSMEENLKFISDLRNLLESELLQIHGSFINGSSERRVYNITNIYFPNIEASVLIKKLDNICVSNGSACTSNIIEPSHVLKAMGKDDNISFSSIRFSLGKYNTKEEILQVITRIKELIG